MIKSVVAGISIFIIVVLLSACGNRLSGLIGKPNSASNEKSEVIDMHGNIEHLDKMDEFVRKAENREKASVRIVHYTTEGDPVYHDLNVKGARIVMTYDTTEDSFGSGRVMKYECDKIERTASDTQLLYTVKGCSGENKELNVLGVSFDVRKQDYFGFILKYGLAEKNEVNTVDEKLAKDLQNGDTAVIDDYRLTTDELQTIYKSMVLSNYLGEKKLELGCNRDPHATYYLKVLINSGSREYRWSECDTGEDGQAMKKIVNVIKEIVINRADYKRLSDVKGA
ncbi:DUF4362 domain-containing protein [Cohnella endophytica]|uniref:DUF4362 domain-containing protein n=1 Tax=Cohnella endophytica TaxID=2419778 RepID=A0A494XGQ7_9BACL|nr:DUF4362 domain-containing protein [Cohnella endophytica]RKP48891.1 DUF4362 domain-containing protein [Cohnella endophytica]